MLSMKRTEKIDCSFGGSACLADCWKRASRRCEAEPKRRAAQCAWRRSPALVL
jgi:hypothetical protein